MGNRGGENKGWGVGVLMLSLRVQQGNLKQKAEVTFSHRRELVSWWIKRKIINNYYILQKASPGSWGMRWWGSGCKWCCVVTRLNLLLQPEEVGGATNTMPSHKPLWANPISHAHSAYWLSWYSGGHKDTPVPSIPKKPLGAIDLCYRFDRGSLHPELWYPQQSFDQKQTQKSKKMGK